jgi:hypothetical protein
MGNFAARAHTLMFLVTLLGSWAIVSGATASKATLWIPFGGIRHRGSRVQQALHVVGSDSHPTVALENYGEYYETNYVNHSRPRLLIFKQLNIGYLEVSAAPRIGKKIASLEAVIDERSGFHSGAEVAWRR